MAVAARREARARGLDLRLAVGLVIALVAFLVGIFVYSGSRPETMSVLVAARDLPQGTLIGEADLRVEEVPVAPQLKAVLMADKAQVVGKVAARPVGAGEPIVATALGEGLPLEAGEVALALPVLDRIYVPHQVREGDRAFLYAIGAGQGGAQQVVLVSQKVRILAVERSRQQVGVGPQVAGPPTSVTIAVPQEEADVVARAIAQNIVALAILPALPAGAAPAPAARPSPTPAPPSPTPAPAGGGR